MGNREFHILETMTDGYLAVNREWQFTYINAAAQRLLAVRAEFLGQKIQEVFPDVGHWLEPYAQVMRTGEPLTFEERYLSAGRLLRISVYPTPDGIEAFFQDLSTSWRAQQDAARVLALTEALNAAQTLEQVTGTVLHNLRQEGCGAVLALYQTEYREGQGESQETLGLRFAADDEALLQLPAFGAAGSQATGLQSVMRLPLGVPSPLADSFRSGELLVLTREAFLARAPGLRLAERVREVVTAPLRSSGRTLGVLVLGLAEEGRTDPVRRSHLMTLATHAASAALRAQLYEQAWRAQVRHRTLLETTSAVLLEVEGDFQVRRPMPDWEALTGQPFAAYRDQGYLNAVHPDDRERVEAQIRAGVEAARPFVIEARLITAAGEEREIVVHAVPIIDERGTGEKGTDERSTVQMWTGTLRDVTAERREGRWQSHTRQLLLELSRAEDAQAVYRITLAEVIRVTAPTRALLTGYVEGSPAQRELAAYAVEPGVVERFRHFVLDQHLDLDAWVDAGCPFWLADALAVLGQGTPDFPDGPGEVLLVPLRHQGEKTALLALSFPAGQRPGAQKLEQLTWLQPHLAQALQRAQLLYALERSEAQGQAILAALDEGVVLLGPQGEVISANRAACELLGLDPEQPLQDAFESRWTTLDEEGRRLSPADYPGVRVLSTREEIKNELLQSIGPGGEKFWFSVNATPLHEGGTVRGSVVSFIDVTEAYLLRRQLEAQAHQDELTGLPNRRRFNQALGEEGAPASAVLLIDLDRFKLVNDTYGHHTGDALLRTVAQRLTQLLALRLSGPLAAGALVTRLAGDEYGVVLPVSRAGEAEQTAEEIVALLAQPVSVGGIEFQVSACVGLSVGSPGAASGAELYRHADLALYEAKRQGPGRWCAYTPALTDTYVRRVQVEHRLRRALHAGELEVHYQPIVMLAEPQWSSFEALARWNDTELGWVGPAEFIAVAEEAGLIYELGSAVLRRALEQSARWSEQWGRPVSVSVNVSSTQLMRPEFPGLVERLLSETGAQARQLTLEMTEALMVQDLAFVTAQLGGLRSLGVRVALDDFGTGFSSLAVLARLPIDVLKVDRAFVRDVHKEPRRQALLSAVVLLAQRLGITVVAEGVEERRELDVLRRLGCAAVQGFYFARPQPAQAFAPCGDVGDEVAGDVGDEVEG